MVFSLGALGLGVIEGLAESTDEGLKKGFERIREEIDSTAETQVKREEKAIDAVNAETKEIMKKLRNAQAVLGGVDDPASAGRAAALLQQAGSVEAFDALINDLQKHSLNYPGTYDFTKYFDSQQDIPGVDLVEASRNYVLGLTLPVPEIGTVEKKGGGIGKLFGVNVAERSRAKADAQLASLGLSMPKITDVALPSITFKSEALKLDKMNAEQELTYLKDKLLDPDTAEDKRGFYQTRITEISDKMGFDAQISNLMLQINQPGADKTKLLKQLQELNQQKSSFDVLSTGNKVDIAKFELAEALANGDTAAADAARDKLVDMGEMSLKDVLAARIEQVRIDIARAGAGVEGDPDFSQAALQQELDELRTLNENIDAAMQAIEIDSKPTPAGVNAVMTSVSKIVNQEIVNNPEFSGLGLVVKNDGSIDFPDGLDTNTKQKINEFRAKREKAYIANMANAMPKDGDVAFVANMLGQGYNTDDMNALGASSDTVAAGTGQQDTDATETDVAAAQDSVATTPEVMSESDKETVATAIKSQHGQTLNRNNLPDIVAEAAATMQEAAVMADGERIVTDTPESGLGPKGDAPVSVEDIVTETTEALTIAYGDEATAELRDAIREEAEKIVAASTQDITVTRMGKPVKYRKVGNDFYAVNEETGRPINVPVGRNSPLYEQLMGLTVTDPTDEIVAEEAETDTAPESFEEKMARLKPDVIYSEGGVESLLKGRPTFPPTDTQVPYRRVGDKFFRIMDDGTLDRSPAGPLVTSRLLEMMAGETETETSASSEPTSRFSVEDAAEAQFRNRDDLTTGQEFPGRPTARSDQTIPADTTTMAGATTERTTPDKGGPFQPPKDVKAASTDFLIAELVNNRMTSETAEELERRIEADTSGKLALRIAKIVERAEKARAQ